MTEKIDKKLLLKIAKNARINLTNSEAEEFLPQLKEIISACQELSKVGVKNVEPSFQPVAVKNVFREDKVEKCLSQEEALKNTVHKKNGFFKGPSVV